ncbi:hypothetical protein [Butyrivibrio sp. XBB1001]|uniref:hypothetical protein n=1 Tax=Butyrivibrio sp. XBB1001 TaxID=1280682 RepID=UPI000688B9BE|nr:hypothetical protein [Butyrivibrio sp. XBB1001]
MSAYLLVEIKAGRFKDDYPEEWKYLIDNNAIVAFPYPFHDEYKNLDVKVFIDLSCHMPYVLYEEKKLFFPRGWAKPFVKRYYMSLVEEQDKRSPHRYFPEDNSFIDGCVFLDVGAAEGIISLSIIERIKKAVLFEADPMWVEALNKTFEPYKDKIKIISCYCSDNCSDGNIMLDEVSARYISDVNADTAPHFVVKADVEGREKKVLAGAEKLLANDNCSFLICTYHKPEDEEEIENLLEGYKGVTGEISKSGGYMLYGIDVGNPSFRKEIVRLVRD